MRWYEGKESGRSVRLDEITVSIEPLMNKCGRKTNLYDVFLFAAIEVGKDEGPTKRN